MTKSELDTGLENNSVKKPTELKATDYSISYKSFSSNITSSMSSKSSISSLSTRLSK